MERSDLEQYATEGNLAAEWLGAMAAFGDLDGQAVVDVGAGNGILGLGALMLGAASVHLIEADSSVAEVAERNAAEVGGHVEV
ncbi:MAG: 50S ribosomal protein L11 methyltransferase, partial [Candidatus Thermoplasmatota archaeon]|nr:50S ribosomal protein L11 methyltransferase [Candidatus Thermoplasmatota archaeon]